MQVENSFSIITLPWTIAAKSLKWRIFFHALFLSLFLSLRFDLGQTPVEYLANCVTKLENEVT